MAEIPQLSELGLAKFAEATWRDGQDGVVSQILDAPTPYVLLQAPTGSGKSNISIASILLGQGYPRYLQNGIVGPPQSSIATATIQLQRQYIGDFADVAREVKGRRNFQCMVEDVKADEAICTVTNPLECEYYNVCPYYAQIRQAEAAKVAIHSYAYALTTMNYTGRFHQQSWLVLDEAHLIDEMLMGFISASVGERVAESFNIPIPKKGVTWSWAGWQQWAEAYVDDVYVQVDACKGREGNKEVRRRMKAGQGLLRAMELLQSDSQWIVVPSMTGWDFMPVWVGKMAETHLYRFGRKKLLMSATILKPDLFANIMGIPPEETTFIDVPSSFPVGRKPVYYDPVGGIKGGGELQDYKPLAEKICDIIRTHPGERGLVHCVSYLISKAIYTYAPPDVRRRLITHRAEDRLSQYELFLSGPPDGVLLSPSMKDGVSLEDESCRFLVVAKMPFPYLGSPQVKARMQTKLGKEWYVWKTMCGLIQMTGRGMRSAEDWCVCYILDSNFARVYNQIGRWIPHYWLDDLRDVQGRLHLGIPK